MSRESRSASGLEDDEAREVAREARAWFDENWDPDLSFGDWWAALAESGWGFPTWPSERYGRGIPAHLATLVNVARRAVGALVATCPGNSRGRVVGGAVDS